MIDTQKVALSSIFGLIFGSIALSAIIVGMYALLDPKSLNDGQFVFVYLFTIPIGGTLGVAAAGGLMALSVGKFKAAAKFLLGGSGAVIVLTGLLVMIVTRTHGGGPPQLFDVVTMPPFAVTLCAAASLIPFGLRALRKM